MAPPLTATSRANRQASEEPTESSSDESSIEQITSQKTGHSRRAQSQESGKKPKKKSKGKRKRHEDDVDGEDEEISASNLGRPLPKLISLFTDLRQLIQESDRHELRMDGGLKNDPALKMNAKEAKILRIRDARSYNSVQELLDLNLIPNLLNIVDETRPSDLTNFYKQISAGARNARGDNINKLCGEVADWLNEQYKTTLSRKKRDGRGINNDVTGKFLCPTRLDWDNEEVRQRLRDRIDGHEYTHDLCIRAFYADYEGNPADPLAGYLQSPLLLKTWKFIFTSPSSSDDIGVKDNIENLPTSSRKSKGTRATKSIAGQARLSTVTPRSIAYAATMLVFALSDAPSWVEEHAGFNFRTLYETIVDFFDNAKEPQQVQNRVAILGWWNKHAFPTTHITGNNDARENTMKMLGM